MPNGRAPADDLLDQSIDSGAQPVDDTRVRTRRSSSERGAAVVEMALVSLLLFVLIFGIISYAFLMSFRQSMTQAAAEGARAAALAPAGTGTARGNAALGQALGGFDQACGADGLTCAIVVAPCGTAQCATVTLGFDYENNPLLPSIPLVSSILPDRLGAESVVEINTVTP